MRRKVTLAFDCNAYISYLFDRTPHYDEDILRDWFPTDDAWIGHVMTGSWDAFTGFEHTYDRIHVAFPDLTGCRTQLSDTNSCVENACAPTEKLIGWGSTRKTYNRERESIRTNVLCFDQIDSKAKAREQFTQIIRGLKETTKIINSNWLRLWALRGCETLNICGSALLTETVNSALLGTNCNELHLPPGSLPTSKLTIPYLDTFQEPLQFEGYFKMEYIPGGMFKLITDTITARQLREGNPDLQQYFRFSDFTKGGELFKRGISSAVGNYAIAFDNYPLRFQRVSGGLLQRVFPYDNVAATIGIKPEVNTAYTNAAYQISFIWHPEAMRALFASLEEVNPEMPFLVRNLAGKWNFSVDPVLVTTTFNPATGLNETCTIDNKRRNQGLWWADFDGGIRYERPELVRAILHLREPGGSCVVDDPLCGSVPASVVQDYDAGNDLCDES